MSNVGVIMTVLTVMLLMLLVFTVGCDGVDQPGGSAAPEAPATSVALATPAKPKAASRSGAVPDTPRPADTPEPADTAVLVGSPLAVLPSYTPEPTATVAPRATLVPVSAKSVDEERAEYIERCKHWALRNMKPIEYSRFEELDPYNMSDLERVLWGSVVVGDESVSGVDHYYDADSDYGLYRFRDDHVEWCQDYWSEPLSKGNAGKRNDLSWGLLCQAKLPGGARSLEDDLQFAFENYESEGMSSVVVNQYARILNWMDIDGDTLLQMEPKPRDIVRTVWEREDDGPSRYRERNRIGDWPLSTSTADDLEWWGIEDVWNGDWEECQSYYPQLFFGRWVPLDDFGAEERIEHAAEYLEQQRDRDDWPEWADGPDRDILIWLE